MRRFVTAHRLVLCEDVQARLVDFDWSIHRRIERVCAHVKHSLAGHRPLFASIAVL